MVNMKHSNYEKEYTVDKSISTVWEEFHSIKGYYENNVSNINKENMDTWYFTYSFRKSRFSSITLSSVSGKVYSKDDSLTMIKMRSGSYFATLLNIVAYIVLIFSINYSVGIVLNAIIKLVLMIFIVFVFINVHNRETKSNVCMLAKELQLYKLQ